MMENRYNAAGDFAIPGVYLSTRHC